MIHKIEVLKASIEMYEIEAKRYGFKNLKGIRNQNIKDYLSNKEYYKYINCSSKLLGIEFAQKYYIKEMSRIIDKEIKEKIKHFKYCIDENDILKKITEQLLDIKEKLMEKLLEQ